MTFGDIKQEVVDLRFKSSRSPMVGRWVNLCEAEVWSSYDWPFKMATDFPLQVQIGDTTPVMPSDFHAVAPRGILDDQGSPVSFMQNDEFSQSYTGTANAWSGRPQHYTLSNGQIYFGPTPDANYSFFMDYSRSLIHYNAANVPTLGVMTQDTDYPVWDSMFHFVLVPGAMAKGLKLTNDPTYQPLDEEYTQILMRMAEFYLDVDAPETSQYGRDPLC